MQRFNAAASGTGNFVGSHVVCMKDFWQLVFETVDRFGTSCGVGYRVPYVDFPVKVVADARRSGLRGLRVIAGKTVARTP